MRVQYASASFKWNKEHFDNIKTKEKVNVHIVSIGFRKNHQKKFKNR